MEKESSPREAFVLYYGILEAYEAVGLELVGDDIVEKYVVPKMAYYLKNFVPHFLGNSPEEKSNEFLHELLSRLKEKLELAQSSESTRFDLSEVWELRAAIFGYESVFIEVLGESVIKNYVFTKISDYLADYLPEVFSLTNMTLEQKFENYIRYLKDSELVQFAEYSLSKVEESFQVQVRTNKCIFARIHDSEAYNDSKVRFCPWGMIGASIIARHEGLETNITKCQFATRGTISDIKAE